MQTKRQIVGSSESWMLQGIYLKLSNKRKWEWSGVNVKESRWSTRWDEKAITVSLWSVQSMCAKFIGLGLPGINPTSFNSSWYSFFFCIAKKTQDMKLNNRIKISFYGLASGFCLGHRRPRGSRKRNLEIVIAEWSMTTSSFTPKRRIQEPPCYPMNTAWCSADAPSPSSVGCPYSHMKDLFKHSLQNLLLLDSVAGLNKRSVLSVEFWNFNTILDNAKF